MTEKIVQSGPEAGDNPVLRRKMATANAGRSAEGPRALLWGLRLALARAAAALCDLPLAVTDAQQTRCAHADLADRLSDERLLILLDGPQGLIGAASLDQATVDALIQQQTLGQIRNRTEPTRRYTNTDAAMVAPLIDRTLDAVSYAHEALQDQHLLAGFRFGARVGDVRSLVLAMSAEDHRVLDLTLDIGLGSLHGHLCLMVPDLPRPVRTEAGPDPQAANGPTLEDASGVIRADLRAVVCRMTLPLTRMTSLRPGDLLPLPDSNFNHTELVGLDCRPVVRGKLGQASGARAVRLYRHGAAVRPPDQATPEFQDHALPNASRMTDRDSAEAAVSATDLDGESIDPSESGMAEAGGDGSSTSDLSGLSPNEIAAEISELAGLEPPDSAPEPSGPA